MRSFLSCHASSILRMQVSRAVPDSHLQQYFDGLPCAAKSSRVNAECSFSIPPTLQVRLAITTLVARLWLKPLFCPFLPVIPLGSTHPLHTFIPSLRSTLRCCRLISLSHLHRLVPFATAKSRRWGLSMIVCVVVKFLCGRPGDSAPLQTARARGQSDFGHRMGDIGACRSKALAPLFATHVT